MMRLDKFLAHTGFGTRKEVKLLIKKKQVTVNGVLCVNDDAKINEEQDIIAVNQEEVVYRRFRYIMMNKPQGVISATDDSRQKTVLDLIAEPIKDLFPVGRLDIDTEGLLLLSNDGPLAHELLSPKKHVQKCYFLTITNPLTSEHIEQIEKGIVIDQNEQCKPAKVEIMDEHHLNLWISEGKFHQVKRMMLACNSEVVYLKRLSMGTLVLDESLKPGEFRDCTEAEIQALTNYKSKG